MNRNDNMPLRPLTRQLCLQGVVLQALRHLGVAVGGWEGAKLEGHLQMNE